MIDWGKTSKKNSEIIKSIVNRAKNTNREEDLGLNLEDLNMDITAANIICPLRLQELLEADDFNFWHDISGIRYHLNRDTGELKNCFLPRFAKPVAAAKGEFK